MAIKPKLSNLSTAELLSLQAEGAVEYDDGIFQLGGDPAGIVWYEMSVLQGPIEISEVDEGGVDLGTKGILQIVRGPGGSSLKITDSNGEQVV